MPFNDIMHDGDLRYRVEKLERRQREDNSGRRLENSSIGAGGLRLIDGGSIEIDGGELRLISEDGVVVARWGDTYYGDWSRGWEFFYPSGQRAFIMGGSAENPAIVIYDVAGNVVFATDAASRSGVARPYVNYRIVPSLSAQSVGEGAASLWPSTDSSSFVELLEGENSVWHPRIAYKISATSVGGGSADWRLLVNGNAVASGNNSGTGIADIPGWGSDILPGHEAEITIEARCADGATRAWVQCTKLYGRQS